MTVSACPPACMTAPALSRGVPSRNRDPLSSRDAVICPSWNPPGSLLSAVPKRNTFTVHTWKIPASARRRILCDAMVCLHLKACSHAVLPVCTAAASGASLASGAGQVAQWRRRMRLRMLGRLRGRSVRSSAGPTCSRHAPNSGYGFNAACGPSTPMFAVHPISATPLRSAHSGPRTLSAPSRIGT